MCIIISHNIRAALSSVILVMAFSFGVPSVVFAAPANTITITDKSGSAQVNYPLQFGRPFIQGEIPNYPQVKIGGTAVPTQADVKNRYPDGSVKYAVIALMIPSIPTGKSVTLSFQNQSRGNNTPLTAAQMLDPKFNFDATMRLTFPALVQGVPNVNIAVWKPITNGSLSLVIDGTRYDLTGLNFSAVTDQTHMRPILIAAFATAGVPAIVDLNAPLDYGPRMVQIIATSASARSITIAPAVSGTDLAPLLFASAKLALPPSSQSVSARTMLQNGDYKLWTSGPIAQTIEIADDTIARKYDVGNGDGYHPFRPRFYATFWPALGKVEVRFAGENGLTTELEDLNYKLALTLGSANPSTVYSADLTGTQASNPKKHTYRSNWTRTFWIGGTPEQKVNIDHNLAYLAATRCFPNFDASVEITEATIARWYKDWTNKPKELYDNAFWTKGMGSTGGRADIAPYPVWSVLWFNRGDWRMREVALRMADLASAWPVNLRESDPTRNMSRDDPKGAGTGFGHVISRANRPTIYSNGLMYVQTETADKVVFVGPGLNRSGWDYDNAHEPSPFYPQYILTGDPYYLQMIYNWAGHDACSYALRTPTGEISDQLRGAAWVSRHRAEAAFAAPDGDPEKRYFTYMLNDALAQWESGLQITGTPFDGAPTKKGGNHYATGVPLIHIWEAKDAPSPNNPEVLVPGSTRAGASPWQTWYLLNSLARMTELGFASDALFKYTGKFLIDMVTISGHPEMVQSYYMPVQKSDRTWMDWPDVVAATLPSYLRSMLGKLTQPIGWEAYILYVKGGAAGLVDIGAPDARKAWDWLNAIYARVTTWNGEQSNWNINPRRDNNTLPAVSTYIPPVPGTVSAREKIPH